mgnify:CR=1 FL=1
MTKIRKGRNPRFQRAINLAKETHEARNSRVELLEKELRDYVPDHWLFAEEETDDEEDNVSEDPDQLENDFDTDHLKPN